MTEPSDRTRGGPSTPREIPETDGVLSRSCKVQGPALVPSFPHPGASTEASWRRADLMDRAYAFEEEEKRQRAGSIFHKGEKGAKMQGRVGGVYQGRGYP